MEGVINIAYLKITVHHSVEDRRFSEHDDSEDRPLSATAADCYWTVITGPECTV